MDWIDVNIELPRKGQKVLCVQDPTKTATKEALFGIYDGRNFIPPTPTHYANFEVGQSRWVDIIYWMPIPKTPQ